MPAPLYRSGSSSSMLPPLWRWKAERHENTSWRSERDEEDYYRSIAPPSYCRSSVPLLLTSAPSYSFPSWSPDASTSSHRRRPLTQTATSGRSYSAAGPSRPETGVVYPKVRNAYIVKEAQALRQARNRIYTLIDASEEAKRNASESGSGVENMAIYNKTRASKKRKRVGNASSAVQVAEPSREQVVNEDKYDVAYGYGEKDHDGVEMYEELQKEEGELQKLWVEGPVSTGAVAGYMRAKKRFLEVVSLVNQWEHMKTTLSMDDDPSSSVTPMEMEPKPLEDSTHTAVGTPIILRLRSRRNSVDTMEDMQQPSIGSDCSSGTTLDGNELMVKEIEQSPTKKSARSSTITQSRASSITPRTLRSSVSARNTPAPSEVSVVTKAPTAKPKRGRKAGTSQVPSREGTVLSPSLRSRRSLSSFGLSEDAEEHSEVDLGITGRLRVRTQLVRPPRFDDYVPSKRIKTNHVVSV